MREATLGNESGLLLSCARSYCDSSPNQDLGELLSLSIVWDQASSLALKHNLMPLMASRILETTFEHLLPEDIKATLKINLYNAIRHDMGFRVWLRDILDLVGRAGISPVLLKGAVLADRLYPASYLRPSGDIDLLVRSDELVPVGLALMEAGYQLKYQLPAAVDELACIDLSPLSRGNACASSPEHSRRYDYHLYFEKADARTPKVVELHWKPAPIRNLVVSLDDIWERTVPIDIDGRPALTLCREHQILLHLFHMIGHGWKEGALRNLLDLSLMVSEPDIDWAEIVRLIKLQKARGHAYHVLTWARDRMGAQVPESVLAELSPSPYERWSSRPFRTFDEMVSLSDTEDDTAQISELRSELALLHSAGDKVRFLLGVLAPPADGLAQMRGLPYGWRLRASYIYRPFGIAWRIATGALRRKGHSNDEITTTVLHSQHGP